MSKKLIPVCVLALSIIAAAKPGWAEEVTVSSGTQSMQVRYDAADIRSGPGARAFLVRVESAAALVCGPAPQASDADADAAYKVCTLIAIDSAVAQAGGPLFADDERTDTSLAVATQ